MPRSKPRDGSEDAFLVGLGIAVQDARTELDLTRYALSKMAGLSPGCIENVERAKQGCSITTLRRICRALDVPPSELLERAEEFDFTTEKMPCRLSISV